MRKQEEEETSKNRVVPKKQRTMVQMGWVVTQPLNSLILIHNYKLNTMIIHRNELTVHNYYKSHPKSRP